MRVVEAKGKLLNAHRTVQPSLAELIWSASLTWAFVLLLTPLAGAQDTRLADIHTALLPLRVRPNGHLETRGATPQFTTIKQQLRDWIESWLSELPSDGDASSLTKELDEELAKADLLCPEPTAYAKNSCEDEIGSTDATGFLDEINVRREGQFFIVVTGVGITCGFDHSAYLYEWKEPESTFATQIAGGHWQPILQSEQDTYTQGAYKPQNIQQVLISPAANVKNEPIDDHLVLTLGNAWGCASGWHPVYYRLWHIGASYREPVLLLDEENSNAYLVAHDPPMQASLGPLWDPSRNDPIYDVLIEFTVGSHDPVQHSYETIRHYRVESDKVKRIDPVALSPRDFIDEWLGEPWKEVVSFTEQKSIQSLEQWHEQGLDPGGGEFDYPAMHCAQSADLWQEAFNSYNEKQPHPTTYFLVRWRPPYHFKMVDISHEPWPGCKEKDPNADDRRTLFPVQEWR